MKVILFILVTTSSVSYALPSWWKNFCEKHLIADDPYQYEPVIVYMHSEATNHDEFVAKLVAKYVELGAMMHWNRVPEYRDTTRLFLRTVGRELRHEQSENPRLDIEDVLDKYEKFELRPKQ